ncbi:MFS transporter [Sphingomonas adhaesiva]|uniref:MFS transporter n=1 Tax=Sphingomonas adhaesiva TaxID=28212 RepID=UPI002FFB3235
MTSTTAHRLVPALCVYLGGFVIGLTLVSFPASSVVLRQLHHFSSEQYGAIYLPQLVASVIGALAGGALARRVSLRAMFAVALLAFALAAALLALSAQVSPGLALALIMAGTASFGFGFGFGGGPLNAFAALLFPRHQGAALTALHMCAGSGLTVAPVLFAALAGHGLWWVGPSALAATSGALFLLTMTATFPAPAQDDAAAADAVHPGRTALFWLCAVIAMLYSVAEGTFSNWATVFLTEERGLSAADAALALTCFWAALTGGRLIATLLAARLTPAVFLIALPCAMAAALLWLPGIADAAQAYGGFAAAGLACSAFFPMLVAFTAARAPQAISWIASMLTAAMMVGVGLGSYAVGALRGGASIASLYGYATAVPVACLLCVALAVALSRRSPA